MLDFVRKSRQIGHPTKLVDRGSVLHFSKGDIKPWDNSDAVNGDKWIATFSRKDSDDPWLDTLLALIGGKFIRGDDICGAVAYTTETQGRIALCTKKVTNDAAQVRIGKQWKGILNGRGSITFHVGGEMINRIREAAILSKVEAEDLQSEMDQMDESNENNETLGRSYWVPENINAEELVNELEALEAEMRMDMESDGVPSYLQPDEGI